MLTFPIRLSRHNITELLVAAEQTASFFPYNNERHKITPIKIEKARPWSYVTEYILKMVGEKAKHAKKKTNTTVELIFDRSRLLKLVSKIQIAGHGKAYKLSEFKVS